MPRPKRNQKFEQARVHDRTHNEARALKREAAAVLEREVSLVEVYEMAIKTLRGRVGDPVAAGRWQRLARMLEPKTK